MSGPSPRSDPGPSGSPPITPESINVAVIDAYPGSPFRCAEIGEGFVLARYDVEPDRLRPGGYVSGPTQFGLADCGLWFLSFVALGRIELMALTSELSIRYLRPCVGETVWARATLDRIGRRAMVGTVRVWADAESRPSAVAQGTYAIPDPD
ncbi:MAG: PaaI family thioesterase [Acidimicrobiales bacterium]